MTLPWTVSALLLLLLLLWSVAPHDGTSFLIQRNYLSSTHTRASRAPPSSVSSSSSLSTLTASSCGWQSHVSTHPRAAAALQKILDDACIAATTTTATINTATTTTTAPTPDLAFFFVGPFHASHFESLVQTLSAALPPTTRLVSIVGGGVIGDQVEIDEPSQPGLSLLLGTLPRGLDHVELFSVQERSMASDNNEQQYWNTLLCGTVDDSDTVASTRSASVLLFADPWSPVEQVIEAISTSQLQQQLQQKSVPPPVTIAGGISVPTGTGSTVALDTTCLPQGSLVGVCFQPASHVQMQVVVAQGCRPVGPAYRITASRDNVVLELDGRPALRVLENLIQNIASPTERNAISSGLLCGIHSQQTDNVDDYLIRQILGFAPSKGGIVVAGLVQDSNILRFHMRDKTTATDDLDLMVQRAQTERLFRSTSTGRSTDNNKDNNGNGTPLCALQVSCVARGRSFFGQPNVDIARTKLLLQSSSSSSSSSSSTTTTSGPAATAVGGFYANGEIGPVGIAGMTTVSTLGSTKGGTFLHGFTTVMALLVDMSQSSNGISTESTASDENMPVNEQTNIWE